MSIIAIFQINTWCGRQQLIFRRWWIRLCRRFRNRTTFR
ncbi:unnamed protein product [Schistosoma curassoni]|uniref:Uncharacterized protein n=1 Tax=Schistosoma curassoni TaxID=6186 RepID=A0A183KVT7_9TREM|nr:unnamed protein product [Schistosoma curassoni]